VHVGADTFDVYRSVNFRGCTNRLVRKLIYAYVFEAMGYDGNSNGNGPKRILQTEV
jgi:hypothetical protein